ncbi:AAA family ATPase [Bacillus tianshenii]|nr:AAA family ATPase [Bacillus tianshenii]
MQQKKQLTLKQIDKQVINWDNSIDKFNETDGLKLLKILEQHQHHEDYRVIKARILGLLATSRSQRIGYIDHLAEKWAALSKELNPQEERAAEIIAHVHVEALITIYEDLTFQLIRETDNRPAKRTVASWYIETSQQFLDEAQNYHTRLSKGLHAARLVNNERLEKKYRELKQVLEETEKALAELIQQATNYIESLSGTFYSSNYAEGMKLAISQIESYKEEWQAYFQKEEGKKTHSCLDELEEMIGLHKIKDNVRKLYHFLQYQQERKAEGYRFKDELSLHMIFTGNPGTGKTTIARLLAKIYHELGILNRPEITEVDRSHLVGAYVGQTEENVMKMVKQAQGGVLFIDEAYSLHREGQSGNDYGQTAIDTLVSAMTSGEYAGTFAVILAGYPEEMRQFLWSNPGLRSRFPESNHLHLDDYSTDELLQIAEMTALDNDYVLTEEAMQEIEKRIDKERVDESFGNARTVKNIVMDAIFQKGSKATSNQALDVVDYTVIEKEDVETNEVSEEKSPEEQLDKIVGLHTIKQEVRTLASFVKVQQMRREKGLKTVPIQLHSVFSGNPGTGKTTVAKIFSQILKESGLLKRGHLVTVGRADLVAGYVGQTALKTKKKIREALGGVLFIDEAYSLFSQRGNDFGKEAIDTLVEEMTKHNDNLVVILAGYTTEMKQLLNSNPGLASRFKKYFHFPDYTADELTQLTEYYAESYSYELSEDAKRYVFEHYTNKKIEGNGRYVTNVVDEAIQKQAYRIFKQDEFEADMSTLTDNDFQVVIEE